MRARIVFALVLVAVAGLAIGVEHTGAKKKKKKSVTVTLEVGAGTPVSDTGLYEYPVSGKVTSSSSKCGGKSNLQLKLVENGDVGNGFLFKTGDGGTYSGVVSTVTPGSTIQVLALEHNEGKVVCKEGASPVVVAS